MVNWTNDDITTTSKHDQKLLCSSKFKTMNKRWTTFYSLLVESKLEFQFQNEVQWKQIKIELFNRTNVASKSLYVDFIRIKFCPSFIERIISYIRDSGCWMLKKETMRGKNNSCSFTAIGASSSPCSETYAGPKPFSERENQNLRDFILARKQQIKAYLTLHSYGQVAIDNFKQD